MRTLGSIHPLLGQALNLGCVGGTALAETDNLSRNRSWVETRRSTVQRWRAGGIDLVMSYVSSGEDGNRGLGNGQLTLLNERVRDGGPGEDCRRRGFAV